MFIECTSENRDEWRNIIKEVDGIVGNHANCPELGLTV